MLHQREYIYDIKRDICCKFSVINRQGYSPIALMKLDDVCTHNITKLNVIFYILQIFDCLYLANKLNMIH